MVAGGLKFVSIIVLVGTNFVSAKYDIGSVSVGLYYNINFNKGKAVTIWPYVISGTAAVITNSQFIYNETTLYIPDCDDHASSTQNEISSAFLKRSNRNFIQIIWSAGELAPRDVLRVLASELAEEILKMFKAGLKRESFHILAYSRGNELAGLIAEEVIDQSNGKFKLHRITALDQPVYYYQNVKFQQVTKYHADFVDAIHTDKYVEGSDFELAHADFWPNGGKAPQPGCNMSSVLGDHSRCSHRKAYEYWAESVANIDGPEFTAYPAANYSEFHEKGPKGTPVPMGIDCPISARGNYYLDTNSKSPYAKGPYVKIPADL